MRTSRCWSDTGIRGLLYHMFLMDMIKEVLYKKLSEMLRGDIEMQDLAYSMIEEIYNKHLNYGKEQKVSET